MLCRDKMLRNHRSLKVYVKIVEKNKKCEGSSVISVITNC